MIADLLIAAAIVALALPVVLARSAFTSVALFVAYGLLLGFAWVRLDAVDVALTEAAIGAGLSGVLLLGAARRLVAGPPVEDAPPGKAQVYELTPWGYSAEPLIQELGRWAAQSSAHDPTLPLSPVSLMLSMRTMVQHNRLAQFARRRIGFAIGEEEFIAEPTMRELPIRRESVRQADTVFRAPVASIIAGGFYAGVPWDELEREAGLTIEGNRDLAMRFASLFRLPAKLA